MSEAGKHNTTDTEHPRFQSPRLDDPDEWKEAVLDRKTYTYEDYLKLPPGSPYQLIGGSLVMTPAPEVYHQEISGNIYDNLRKYIKKNDLGKVYFAPIDVRFSDTNVFQPDIIFIHKDRIGIIGQKNIQGPPDIVMEILFPASGYWDLREKYDVYEKSGVPEYWIIDPMRKEIEVFENIDRQYRSSQKARETGAVSSKVLAGFSVNLSDIF